MATDDVKPLAACGRSRHGPDVREGDVANVTPRDDGHRGRDLVTPLAQGTISNALVGKVDGAQIGQLALEGPEGECVVDDGDSEVRLLLLDKFPSRLLSKFLSIKGSLASWDTGGSPADEEFLPSRTTFRDIGSEPHLAGGIRVFRL